MNRAISLRPGNWGNHATLGNVAYRAGLYPEAIKAFQRFAELRPDSASAFQWLGTAQHAAGDVEAASLSYKRAIEIAPNANAYSNLGTLDVRGGEILRSHPRRTRKAVALRPHDPSLQRNLADALAKAGDKRSASTGYPRALALANDVLAVSPTDPFR